MNSPVIVIGPPRSGTTMTARVLQDWMGIIMDGAPMLPDRTINPFGWYEDSRIVEANHLFLNRNISINAWTRRFKRYIRAMVKLNRPWGFKDPRIIPLLSYALTFFKSPTVIRCHRKKALVVNSYIKKLGWTEEESERRYDRDEQSLDEQLKNITHMRIDFDNYISEETVIEFFKSHTILRYGT